MNALDRYRRWFDYEVDSHAKTMASLQAAPAELRARGGYQKALDLMAHIIAARQLWLHRFGVTPEGPTDLFPKGSGLADLEERLRRTQQAWAEYLKGLRESDLGRVFEYRSLEGPRFRNSVEDILTQLFGHSWYHRGQIAALVRAIGGQPAETDFVFWSRQRIS